MSNISHSLVEATSARIQPKLGAYRKLREQRPSQILAKDPSRLTLRARYAAPTGAAPTRLDLERILGNNDLLDLNYFERGLRVARSVGRIIFQGPGGQARGYATGFMVSPSLLLTNHHVFGTAADTQAAVIEFDFQLDPRGNPRPTERFRFQSNMFFYSNQNLDFALVAVDSTPLLRGTRLTDYGWLQLNPSLGKVNKGEYVSIIQHPGGQPKQLAIRENQLVDIEEGGVHLVYLSDTAPGSSGSPIFNDSWQVVGLHHSGMPKKNAQGQWLGKDNKPVPQNATEDQIQWVANEGIRASSIVNAVTQFAPGGILRDEFIASTKQESGNQPVESSQTDACPHSDNGSISGPVMRSTSDGLLVTVPVSFRVQLLGTGSQPVRHPTLGVLPIAPAAGNNASDGDAADERKIIDADMRNRDQKGYDTNFLGVKVSLPTLTAKGLEQVSRRLDKGGKNNHILPYYHYSVVMNAKRRLCFFTASNYDAQKKFRGQLSRKKLGEDKWDIDTRIPPEHQIQKREIYDATDYDLGHIVRREDNYWGESEEEAVYANWDTFFYTNCTPQHFAFNRSGSKDENDEGGGIWGALEMSIAKQLKKQNDRLCQFAGPVMSKKDEMFRDVVPVPRQYWKVIVAMHQGKLKAWAFVLSQEKLIKDIEADITVGEEFKPYHVSLSKIEAITEVRFPKEVKAADVKAKIAGAKAEERINSIESFQF